MSEKYSRIVSDWPVFRLKLHGSVDARKQAITDLSCDALGMLNKFVVIKRFPNT